ncbi:hypothetical protein HQ585_11555 [candidate division KSB1 bacterium]|nr:hypothetical protein [candidate division KSB1 bacterium]
MFFNSTNFIFGLIGAIVAIYTLYEIFNKKPYISKVSFFKDVHRNKDTEEPVNCIEIEIINTKEHNISIKSFHVYKRYTCFLWGFKEKCPRWKDNNFPNFSWDINMLRKLRNHIIKDSQKFKVFIEKYDHQSNYVIVAKTSNRSCRAVYYQPDN